MNQLLETCRPLLKRICEYWSFHRRGVEIPEVQVRSDLLNEFAAIEERCKNDPALAAEFREIELPLMFFIDYTIKEGNFQYSNSWKELARGYNEFSGDEKFFELLEKTMQSEHATHQKSNLLELYYVMLGLGFDGIYKSDQSRVVNEMHSCLDELPPPVDVWKDTITEQPEPDLEKKVSNSWKKRLWCGLTASFVFAVGCLAFNLWTFYEATARYEKAIQRALYEASPHVWSTSRQGGEELRSGGGGIKEQVDKAIEDAGATAERKGDS